jgi:DNA-binding XRE family transcriptional regulator
MRETIVREVKMHGKIQLNHELVIKLRRNLGLSQFEMAMQCSEKRLNIALSTIKRVETGKKILLRTALSISEFFQCSLESLTVGCNTTKQNMPEQIRGSNVFTFSRQFELDLFNICLKHTIQSHKLHLISVCALANMGKTRLVGEFIDVAQKQGFTSFRQSILHDQNLPWFHALTSLCGYEILQVGSLHNTMLQQHNPQLRVNRICKACIDKLETEQGPILLVLEYLHWAKESLILCIIQMIVALSDRPFVVVLTFLPEVEQEVNSWCQTLLNIPVLNLELKALAGHNPRELAQQNLCANGHIN